MDASINIGVTSTFNAVPNASSKCACPAGLLTQSPCGCSRPCSRHGVICVDAVHGSACLRNRGVHEFSGDDLSSSISALSKQRRRPCSVSVRYFIPNDLGCGIFYSVDCSKLAANDRSRQMLRSAPCSRILDVLRRIARHAQGRSCNCKESLASTLPPSGAALADGRRRHCRRSVGRSGHRLHESCTVFCGEQRTDHPVQPTRA